MKVLVKNIQDVSNKILKKIGVPDDEIEIIVNSILYAHLTNRSAHGIGRLPIYVRKINDGLMSPKTTLIALKEEPAVSHFDAQNGFGQVAAYKGMEIAINKAKVYGTGVVGIKGSNNFGTAGFFVELAAKNNMAGFMFSNSSPAITPTGGNKPIFGTNPISIGFPGGNNKSPVILDMATSSVARGKVRLAAVNKEKIPNNWALDADGNPTNDPIEALKGSMMPIGGYKGYGLSLVVDVLAGLLTGAAFGGNVKPLNHKNAISNYGHFIIVFNISFFQEITSFHDKMDYLTKNVKACGNKHEIFLPGEKEYNFKKDSPEIVSVSDKQVKEINSLAEQLEIDSKLKNNIK